MNKTHTPGPWRVEDPPMNDHGASLAIMGPGKADRTQLYIAEVWKIDDTAREMAMDAEGKANARLIASAPDLLKACKATLPFLETEDHRRIPGRGDCPLTAMLRKAIAQAEGE